MRVFVKLASAVLVGMFLNGTAFAEEGNPKKGKKVFKKCKACHSLKEGEVVSGPSLYKILGRKVGTEKDYEYSKAFEGLNFVWDEAKLAEFLAKPKKVIPKNKMIFSGLKKEKDIKNLLAYFKSKFEEK